MNIDKWVADDISLDLELSEKKDTFAGYGLTKTKQALNKLAKTYYKAKVTRLLLESMHKYITSLQSYGRFRTSMLKTARDLVFEAIDVCIEYGIEYGYLHITDKLMVVCINLEGEQLRWVFYKDELSSSQIRLVNAESFPKIDVVEDKENITDLTKIEKIAIKLLPPPPKIEEES